MTTVRVIGCGNPDAGDDAAGIVAVERAREALETIPGVEVLPQVSPLDVVHHLDGADAVVVADAIRTPGGARPPGTLVRAVAGPGGLPAEIGSSLSSHGFGVVEAFGLASAIGPLPGSWWSAWRRSRLPPGGRCPGPFERRCRISPTRSCGRRGALPGRPNGPQRPGRPTRHAATSR